MNILNCLKRPATLFVCALCLCAFQPAHASPQTNEQMSGWVLSDDGVWFYVWDSIGSSGQTYCKENCDWGCAKAPGGTGITDCTYRVIEQNNDVYPCGGPNALNQTHTHPKWVIK